MAASAELGPNVAGVANVPADISDREVEDLACAGVRAIRFNLYRGGSGAGDDLLRLALRVASIADMHTEVYVDAVDPHALMFGTDLPSTRARRPFDAGDVALIEESLGKEALPEGLRVNARAFYRMRPG